MSDETTSVAINKDEKVELNTPRLLLRAATDNDAQYMNKAFSDPDVMRYWSEPPHPSLERTAKWMQSMTNNTGNGVRDFIICLKPGLTPIGKCGVWEGNEIGFLLVKEQWGKGLALEALRVVLPQLFDDLGFESLVADIDPRNDASLGLLKKVGFEDDGYKEKTLEINGEWVDSQYLKLTGERWREYRIAKTQTR